MREAIMFWWRIVHTCDTYGRVLSYEVDVNILIGSFSFPITNPPSYSSATRYDVIILSRDFQQTNYAKCMPTFALGWFELDRKWCHCLRLCLVWRIRCWPFRDTGMKVFVSRKYRWRKRWCTFDGRTSCGRWTQIQSQWLQWKFLKLNKNIEF